MNENERTNLKIPFHFINFFRDKYLLSQKIKSQNKNTDVLIKDTINSKLKENSCQYIKKNIINENSPITRNSKSKFPPLLGKRTKSKNIINKIETKKILNGIDNYMTNGYKLNGKNEQYQLLKLTRKISLRDIIKNKNEQNIKMRNVNQKIYSLSPKNENYKTNYTYLKNKTLDPSLKFNSIEVDKINKKFKNNQKTKSVEGKENVHKLNLTKSYDKNLHNINNELTTKSNYTYLRRTNRFNSNEIYSKKKVLLKYCVYPGNNTKLINLVMEHRRDVWEKVPTSHYRYCDMVWAPLTSNIDFKTCQFMHSYVNHIPLNEEISNKMRLYGNLIQHCEKKKIDVYKIFPFTIILTLSHYSFNEQIDNFKILFKEIDKYTPKSEIFFSKLFNALLNKKIGSKQTINIPKTFNSGKNMWIIKPVNLNRGRCIKVLNNLDSILREMKLIQTFRKINIVDNNNISINNYSNNNYDNINTHCKNNSPEKYKNNSNGIKCEYIMIQKYLEKPLLYQGRKFDIRIWVMFITNREDEIFIFKEGHLKAASLKYNPNSDDLFIHLTNYSVQKYHSNFSEKEIGNEIPFYDFQYELDIKHSSKNFKKDIYPKIVRIVRLTGGAAKKGKMNFMGFKNCFEIFGYDFILDENYNPYLLEINSNPGLEFSSPLIKQLLPRMIDDAFKLTIDEENILSNVFIHQESEFPVDYHKNYENMWERYTIL